MNDEGGVSDIQFRIRHTMLPVSDIDRTIDFYTRLLGMDIMRLREPPGQRVAYVGYGSEDDGPAFELIQNGGVVKTRKCPPGRDISPFTFPISTSYAPL